MIQIFVNNDYDENGIYGEIVEKIHTPGINKNKDINYN